MADVKSTIKSKVEEVSAASKQALNALGENASKAAAAVLDQSKKAAETVSENVSNAASFVGNQAENATSSVSGGLKSVARSIRQVAPAEGQVGDAATGVAQSFSNAAGYLDRQGVEGISKDLSAIIEKNPLAAVMVGVGLGFLLGRISNSK